MFFPANASAPWHHVVRDPEVTWSENGRFPADAADAEEQKPHRPSACRRTRAHAHVPGVSNLCRYANEASRRQLCSPNSGVWLPRRANTINLGNALATAMQSCAADIAWRISAGRRSLRSSRQPVAWSLTGVTTAFVHLTLRYRNRSCPSTTHRSGDLSINAAVEQLATYEIDLTIEQPSFGQKVGQCASGEVWHHNGLSAPKRGYKIVVNVNRQLFSSYAQCLSFLNSTSLLQSAIFAMIFPPSAQCDVTMIL